MTANAALLATRYARRPLLLEPTAARDLATRIRALDDRAFARPGRLQAFLRRVGLAGASSDASGARIMAMDDDYDYAPPPIEQRLAYSPLWAGEPEDYGFCWSLKDGIALMQCDTPLVERGEEFCGVAYHGYDTLKAAIGEAMADSRVRGVFLRMSSPGGVVAGGLPALAQFMRQARATGNSTGKPIHVHADMACSAAYWICAQADRITAPRVGLVGSIGAVLVHENYASALEKAGVEITPIQFGEQKTAGAWWEALSPEAKADLQAEIDQCGRDFVADVTLGRPVLSSEVLIGTQARVFMAHHDDAARSGLGLGFVDAICSEEEAFEALYAEVSPPEPALGVVSPAPATGRSASPPKKEKSMATPAPKVAAQVAPTAKAAAMKAERAKLATRMAEIDAATGDDAGGEGDAPATEAETPAEGEEGEEDDPPAPPLAAEPDTAGETQAIAASAEAAAHPALALSAISSGLTLKQFKAMATTAGQPGKRSPLADAMAGSRRLGPDATKAGGGGSTLAANARKRAGVAD